MKKRRLKIAATYLLVGVTLNYILAWSLALWSPNTSSTLPPEDPLVDGYPATVAGPDGREGWWSTARGVGILIQQPFSAKGTKMASDTGEQAERRPITIAAGRCSPCDR